MNDGVEDPRELTEDNEVCPICGIVHADAPDDIAVLGLSILDWESPTPSNTVVSEP
jgi:hypothetical protein